VAPVTPQTRTFDPSGLLDLFDGRYADIRRETCEVNRLCNETRLCADGLVDAVGIPDEVLGAPIGLTDDMETPD
jgi:hypothetical protein